MFERIAQLGACGLHSLGKWGQAGIFLLQVLARRPRWRQSLPLIIAELFSIGVLSLVIIIIAGLFIGMVVGLQGHHTLNKFGATSELGVLLALSITRELGPVVSALLFAGRAGSALTAEIGLMKTTEQLSSMEMIGVDPLWRVIFPRLIGGLISLPILAMVFSSVAIWGGCFVGVSWLGIDAGQFWSNMQASVDFRLDILNGIIKSIVFGFLVTWIAVFQGYATTPTAAGIARATTRTVVYGSLAVLAMDFVLTAMMIGGW